MTVTNFGNNFEIEEDSNGDYVVTYLPTDIVIERIDSGNEEKIFEVAAQISTLKGRTSGATVYDDATQTVGDGTTSAEHESVNTDDLLVNNGLVVGEHFEIEEDSNGDYVVTYTPTSTVIERIDSGDGEKIFEVGVQISTLKGKTSGATVYDDATQTVGDGTTSAEHESVNTEQADVTGEPVVQADRSTISSGVSAGSWVNIVDTEVSDPLGIFNSNAQIVPTSDLPVMVIVQAQIQASSAGDLVEVRIRDVDSNTDIHFGEPLDALAASTDGVQMTLIGTLNANNAHELQVRNLDSTFDVGRNQSYINLFKKVVHL